MRAVALENIDKMMARGTHYAVAQLMPQLPAIIGFDGIGALDDGRLVGFGGMKPPYGAMAERVVVPATHIAPIPDGVDAVSAAAIPSSALSALLSLRTLAKMQAGETVLINGATGFAGRLAVQIARLLGAGRIAGSGRHPASLHAIQDLGADAVVDLKSDDAQIRDAYALGAGDGYDVVLDLLWGHPTELLLKALTPVQPSFARKRTRFVQIGEAAGPTIALAAEALRTSGVEITGGGNIPPAAIGECVAQVWDWLRERKLRADVEPVPLSQIGEAWERADLHGKRLVMML